MGESAISSGPFRLLPARRLLLEGARPVRLGSHAFDILIALVERAGEVVSKEELIARQPGLYDACGRSESEDPGPRFVALGDGQAAIAMSSPSLDVATPSSR